MNIESFVVHVGGVMDLLYNGFIVEKKERGISNRRNRVAVWLIP